MNCPESGMACAYYACGEFGCAKQVAPAAADPSKAEALLNVIGDGGLGAHGLTSEEMHTLRAALRQAVTNERRISGVDSAAKPLTTAMPDDEARRFADWDALNKSIGEYVSEFEFGDEGYKPTRQERLLIFDCIQGLLVEEAFLKAIAQVYPIRSQFVSSAKPLAHSGCPRCSAPTAAGCNDKGCFYLESGAGPE